MVGWILIEDTNIDYPVMQTPTDPTYYLKHDFEKNYTDYGCPFMQADCDALAPSDNLILYGHNMKDGSMFADLAKYRSKDFWQSHKTVWFDTALGSCAYEIFAVIHTTVQADTADAFPFYRFVDAATPEEFADYVSACQARALYDTGISAKYGDKLLTLSTCDNITAPCCAETTAAEVDGAATICCARISANSTAIGGNAICCGSRKSNPPRNCGPTRQG